MNVKELRELLSQHPDELEILFECFSDYTRLDAEDIEIGQAVDKGDWLMRSHPTMSQENKDKENTYLLFPGN